MLCPVSNIYHATRVCATAAAYTRARDILYLSEKFTQKFLADAVSLKLLGVKVAATKHWRDCAASTQQKHEKLKF